MLVFCGGGIYWDGDGSEFRCMCGGVLCVCIIHEGVVFTARGWLVGMRREEHWQGILFGNGSIYLGWEREERATKKMGRYLEGGGC